MPRPHDPVPDDRIPEDRIAVPARDETLQSGPGQADPQLQLSEGRASGLQIAVVAFACMLIIGITIYGLGRPAPTDGDIMASAPPAQETTGAAPADTAAPQQIPAKEPVPHLVKPGVVGSDSAR